MGKNKTKSLNSDDLTKNTQHLEDTKRISKGTMKSDPKKNKIVPYLQFAF